MSAEQEILDRAAALLKNAQKDPKNPDLWPEYRDLLKAVQVRSRAIEAEIRKAGAVLEELEDKERACLVMADAFEDFREAFDLKPSRSRRKR